MVISSQLTPLVVRGFEGYSMTYICYSCSYIDNVRGLSILRTWIPVVFLHRKIDPGSSGESCQDRMQNHGRS